MSFTDLISINSFKAFLEIAKDGDKVLYGIGGADPESRLSKEIQKAHDNGDVFLIDNKTKDGRYEYRAYRTKPQWTTHINNALEDSNDF